MGAVRFGKTWACWWKVAQNQRGQSLMEYLLLVCLIAVGATATVKVVGQNIQAQFNNISRSLRGESQNTRMDRLDDRQVRQKDFHDFLQR